MTLRLPAEDTAQNLERSDILWSKRHPRGEPGRGPRAGGVTLVGQNVDLVPFVEEFGIVVRPQPRNAPAALLYTTAGLPATTG